MWPDLAAALLFAWGFLLVRRSVPHAASPCLPDGWWAGATTPTPPVSRTVLVVVDGLRWADAHAALEPLTQAPGGNDATWGPARLMAPPPTATLPAVASLLTGGLPAFADVGAGVVSGPAGPTPDDTWIGRLRACVPGVRVVAFGDAAWAAVVGAGGLDAGSWSVPALDVSSADDSAVWAALEAEVGTASRAPRVAIAHVNAVDHAQHVGGAGSPGARAALTSVAANLTRLVSSLTSPSACAAATTGDTLLLVLGDHGCTAAGGNHGGASRAERETAVAALSARAACRAREDGAAGAAPRPPRPPLALTTPDLAPALALLHGAPPPFASVGRLPAGLWGLVFNASSYPHALAANAAQVRRYVAAAPWAVGGAHQPALAAHLAAARTVAETEAALDAIAAAAARHHAQFGWARMGAGLAGLVGVAAARVAGVVRDGPAAALPLLAAAAHSASLFSVGCLQVEGWVVAGLAACVTAGTARRPAAAAAALAATAAAAGAFLPRTARTAAEAMHQAAVSSRPVHAAWPWALAAVQAGCTAAAAGGSAPATAVALALAASAAFHASGHVPEVAGLRMDLSAGLPHGLAVAVVAADALHPFVLAGAAAALAGPRAAAAHAAVRSTTLAAAAVSAAVQARHILAPSVFMPRFVFELAFCAAAAAGRVMVDGWVAVVSRRRVRKKAGQAQ